MAGKTRALQPIALIVLLAAGVMFAALFMPFVRQGCIFCPIAIPGSTFQLPTFSLMQGLDGWVVLCVVVAIFLEAAAYLRSRRRAAAIAALLLSGVALTLCVFEGINSAGRVVGLDATAQPTQFGEQTLNPPAYWTFGLYVFFGAAVVAVVASFAVVLFSRPARHRPPDPMAVSIPTS